MANTADASVVAVAMTSTSAPDRTGCRRARRKQYFVARTSSSVCEITADSRSPMVPFRRCLAGSASAMRVCLDGGDGITWQSAVRGPKAADDGLRRTIVLDDHKGRPYDRRAKPRPGPPRGDAAIRAGRPYIATVGAALVAARRPTWIPGDHKGRLTRVSATPIRASSGNAGLAATRR
jgi:hypothetical protein